MRYKNETKFILPIGKQEHIKPYGISREFSKKEIEENDELQSRLNNHNISEYTGTVTEPPKKKVQDIRYEIDPTMMQGKLITGTAKGGNKPVQYIMADAEGNDGVSMDSDTAITSFGKDIHKAAEYIEEGVNAQTFKNGADAMEAELNTEFEQSTFDDEDTLADNESERDGAQDADESIATDAQMFLQQRGKNGAEVTTAKQMIETEVTSQMNKVNKSLAEKLDDSEVAPLTATGKVADFLKQPLNAKKFMIAKETDSTFLKEVNSVSGSDTIKQLVKQRLNEIK